MHNAIGTHTVRICALCSTTPHCDARAHMHAHHVLRHACARTCYAHQAHTRACVRQ